MAIISTSSVDCSGCTACKDICPVGAISFTIDKEGFYVPTINEKCIKCSKCAKVCPSMNDGFIREQFNMKAFAVKHKKDEVRYNSASGAFFPAIAEYVINDLKGFVCGCIIDSNLKIKHVISNELEMVQKMQGSKYVQSDIGNCFPEIIDLLKRDTFVLFTGSSCQVTGLISLLESKNVSTDKLITIDFFCHGVPSPLIWKEYLDFYERKTCKKITNYEFRNKKYGWGNNRKGPSYLFTAYFNHGVDNSSFEVRLWGKIFGTDLCTRQYCHSCPYTTVNKNADFTMGDFWGIDKVIPQMDDKKGTSVVISRNKKGSDLLDNLGDKIDVCQVELEKAVARQQNAFKASCANKERNNFWNLYFAEGFESVSKKYFEYKKINAIKFRIKVILFKFNILKSF